MKDLFVTLAMVLDCPLCRDDLKPYADLLEREFTHGEILLIDNGVTDGAAAPLLEEFARVRLLKLTAPVSSEVAMAAALENAIGDISVIGTPDNLTPEAVLESVELCCAGNDVVIGVSAIRRPWWYSFGSLVFRLIWGRMIQYRLPRNDTGLRTVSRRAANAVISMGRFHHQLLVLLGSVGYRTTELEYRLPPTYRRHFAVGPALSRGMSLLVFCSIRPLRMINFLGLLASGMALVFASYSLLIHLFKHNVVEGWTTLILFTSIQFFFLFLILALLGEYIVRLLLDRADAAAYHVISERHSSVMLDTDKLNVLENSEAETVNQVQSGRDR